MDLTMTQTNTGSSRHPENEHATGPHDDIDNNAVLSTSR